MVSVTSASRYITSVSRSMYIRDLIPRKFAELAEAVPIVAATVKARCRCLRVPQIFHRGSYMSAHVLLNLLNELGKSDKCKACRTIYRFFATNLINSITLEHEC